MSKKKYDVATPAKPLSSSPFAALANVRDALPKGEEALVDTNVESSPAKTPPSPETFARAVVRKERKGHGGKTATVVEGVPEALREKHCAAMKRSFGCGARVEGELIVLQGELADRAATWLSENGARKVVRGS